LLQGVLTMGNYWGIQLVGALMNILGVLGIILGAYSCTINRFGFAIGLGIIFGGVFLVAQGQMLGLAIGLARNVAHIAENMHSNA